jgi:hypothetical protein
MLRGDDVGVAATPAFSGNSATPEGFPIRLPMRAARGKTRASAAAENSGMRTQAGGKIFRD